MWLSRNTNPMPSNQQDNQKLGILRFSLFSNDEYFVDAFAIFCGMGITNVMNFQAVSQANAKLKVQSASSAHTIINTKISINVSINIITNVSINVSKKARKHINVDYSLGHNGRSLIPSAGNNFE